MRVVVVPALVIGKDGTTSPQPRREREGGIAGKGLAD